MCYKSHFVISEPFLLLCQCDGIAAKYNTLGSIGVGTRPHPPLPMSDLGTWYDPQLIEGSPIEEGLRDRQYGWHEAKGVRQQMIAKPLDCESK